MRKFKNSTIGLLVAALVAPDSQRARGYFADARGMLHGHIRRSKILSNLAWSAWQALQ